MRSLFTGLFVGLMLLCTACETDPVFYTSDPPQPVIYGVFNRLDDIHYLKVGKSFGAEVDPLLSAQVYDSLYFKDVDVRVFRSRRGEPVGTPFQLKLVKDLPKEAGIFHSPDQQIYSFNTRLGSEIYVEVELPGMPLATGHVELVSQAIIHSPFEAQQYIYLVPSAPWLVLWSGSEWNEIDVAFEFIEELDDLTLRSKWVHIQNANYFDSPYDKYREMKITYDEFIREVLLQIQPNDSVGQVFLGNISIDIHSGGKSMVQYVKYLNGYNDFNTMEFSNIKNGLGLLASRTTYEKDSLRFDRDTRQQLINERKLKILKISPWN